MNPVQNSLQSLLTAYSQIGRPKSSESFVDKFARDNITGVPLLNDTFFRISSIFEQIIYEFDAQHIELQNRQHWKLYKICRLTVKHPCFKSAPDKVQNPIKTSRKILYNYNTELYKTLLNILITTYQQLESGESFIETFAANINETILKHRVTDKKQTPSMAIETLYVCRNFIEDEQTPFFIFFSISFLISHHPSFPSLSEKRKWRLKNISTILTKKLTSFLLNANYEDHPIIQKIKQVTSEWWTNPIYRALENTVFGMETADLTISFLIEQTKSWSFETRLFLIMQILEKRQRLKFDPLTKTQILLTFFHTTLFFPLSEDDKGAVFYIFLKKDYLQNKFTRETLGFNP